MNDTKQHIAFKIKEYFKINHELILSCLEEMVQLETPSRNKAAQDRFFKFLQTRFNAIGYECIRVKGRQTGGYLFAKPKDRVRGLPIQLLVGHCDTVWDFNTPDKPKISDLNGRMSGPGIYDMKAGLAQIVFALKALKDLRVSLKVIPVVLINSDEEIGSHESREIIKRLSRISNRAFVLEPPLGLEGKLKTSRKGIGKFTITVKGKAAHAGLDPTKGANAIVELAHQVQQLHEMNDFERGITVNVGTIEGGQSVNVVAPESRAAIDVRVANTEDAGFITERIKTLKPKSKDIELIIEGEIGRPPLERTKRNIKLWKRAQANAEILGFSIDEANAGGGSDGNFTSLYTATLDGLGTVGDGAHAAHEYILKDTVIERSALLTLLLMEEPMT